MQIPKIVLPGLLLGLGLIVAGCQQADQEMPPSSLVTYVVPDSSTGTSQAAVVKEETPLVFTAQFLPLDGEGNLVGRQNVAQQARRVLRNIELVLKEGNASMNDLVKLHIYVTSNAAADRVRSYLARHFSGAVKPAASFVVSDLPHPKARVAMDAVAASHASSATRHFRYLHSDSLYAVPTEGHGTLVSSTGLVYVSGQTVGGPMLEATQKTLDSLHATLEYMDLKADDVAQVKSFMQPIDRAAEVEKQIAAAYDARPGPPLISMEWTNGDYLYYLSVDKEEGLFPIEIELIASRDSVRETDAAVTYGTPPWLEALPTYSRFAEVHSGQLVYISGLYGNPEDSEEAQIRAIFEQLQTVLDKTGSNMDHLVHGTYYVTNKASSDQLNKIRQEYYDPNRPPTSAKMPVNAVGREGADISFDMVAVAP